MERLYQTYKDQVEFLLVYIREAHPDSVLYVERDGKEALEKIEQTDSWDSRAEAATVCAASLDLSIPTVVDKADNKVSRDYAGWPDRMAVVGLDGKIAYYGGPGPQGFKPAEVEQWLQTYRLSSLRD